MEGNVFFFCYRIFVNLKESVSIWEYGIVSLNGVLMIFFLKFLRISLVIVRLEVDLNFDLLIF